MTTPGGTASKIIKSISFYLGFPLLLVGGICLLPFMCAQKGRFSRAAPDAPPHEQPHHNYDSARAAVQVQVQALKRKSINSPAGHEQAAALFTRLLKDDMAPFWLGTPWDFNGVTQTPGEGTIACGYFVTTLLRDMGVPLNRVALAQCASSKLITALTNGKFVKHYSNMNFDAFIAAVSSRGKGVTIAGLDFHTGLLVHDGGELWFIHSNYINRQGVVMEPAAQSAALKASKTRMCGHITDDPAFLKRWLKVL